MKTITAIALIILMSGCAQSGKTLRIIGGEPQKGSITMSHISSSDKPPQVNWEKSALIAQKRCRDWGFKNVITPEPLSSKLSCIYVISLDRCAKFNHIYRYHCIGDVHLSTDY